MKDTKKCVESRQLHKEDCLQEIRVELRGNVGVRSISSTSEKGRNDVNEYASGLLEKILEPNNMNLAYKRVKANKGSYGVDGMTVNELLQFLKQNGKQLIQSLLEGKIGIRVHPKPVDKFKQKLKAITGRSKSMSIEKRMEKLRQCITGWANYFSMADMMARSITVVPARANRTNLAESEVVAKKKVAAYC